MRRARTAVLAMVALPVVGCSDDGSGTWTAQPKPVTGSFVGTVAGSDAYVAIVVGPRFLSRRARARPW